MAASTKTAPAPTPSKTSSSTKSSTFKLRPLGDKILVKRDEAESRTESGIYLPENAKDKPKSGVVQAIGNGTLNTDTGERTPLTVKKGDKIIFSSYAGSEVKLDGVELLIMSEDEVLAIVD